MLKVTVKRSIKSGMLSGKKFELTAKAEDSDGKDLSSLFKGYPDEHVLAYKSHFVEKAISVRRSELIKGARFSAATLNEVIEFEDNLKMAVQHLRHMLAIVEAGDAEVVIEP